MPIITSTRGQGQSIDLSAKIDLIDGQMAVVPKGVEHKPGAAAETRLLLIEPRGVVNTGDGAADARTVENDQWI